jgi:hypothetical protein
MDTLRELAIEHLLLRMRPINRALRVAVERQSRAASQLGRPDLTSVCVTPDHVARLLDDVDSVIQGAGASPIAAAQLSDDECAAESELRSIAATIHRALPLDRVERHLALEAFEMEALLVCAAPQLDCSYERIFAYVLDDLSRRGPCIELLAHLTASSIADRLSRRTALGRHGRLRRCGILRAIGEVTNELRQELALTPAAWDLLLGANVPVASFRDPQAIAAAPRPSDDTLVRLGRALGGGELDVVGVWGGSAGERDDAAMALAAAAGVPLHRAPEAAETLPAAIESAVTAGALLWVPLDDHQLPPMLVDAEVRLCLTASRARRHLPLLESHRYAELELATPGFGARTAMWKAAVPELDAKAASEYASRFRMGAPEIRATASVARTAARLASNGVASPVASHLDAACAVVTRRGTDGTAHLVVPMRSADDLVLPPELHRQVLEVASFSRAWPRVVEEWDLGRALGATRGIKALFTGEPGTGKSLAAEVIAHTAGSPLLKIDLSQVVSKWIGETEKNLENAFRAAEESCAVLLFDEADALFGKRAEVNHGTDRYANLEVSYLLQRLEEFEGLVILTSNLRDQIDAAFTRRFQVLLHFPRPSETLRRSLWQKALPERLAVGLDLACLARLDMTGAAIVNSARTAALLAASAGCERIEMRHVITGVARQYRREARVLTAHDLGVHRDLLVGEA